MKESVLIVGNSPCLRSIQYDKIPKDVDVFRLNQFFFEDRYWVGDVADLVMLAANAACAEKFYTMKTLEYRHEYKIKNMMYSGSYEGGLITAKRLSDLCGIKFWGDIFREKAKNTDFRFAELIMYFAYQRKGPTSGVCGIAIGAALGYKRIYVAGIDFYSTQEPYVFDSNKKNIKHFYWDIDKQNQSIDGGFHSKGVETECVRYCKEYMRENGGEIYSVCKQSSINEYLPQAPDIDDKEQCFLANKERRIMEPKVDYTDDIVMIPKHKGVGLNVSVKSFLLQVLDQDERMLDKYRENVFFKLTEQLIHYIELGVKITRYIASSIGRRR